ncbi:hypothetical protein HK097_000311 [Rhizophlyctis rosea]|uniref:Uncharacterized protein n=1 Tax=Rhizophlyctis rosea TaxID=64517 RepID=A0AAD5S860_9FUNG|nr:hypothetical protein HK097_000311 [Rhizophlyctis rosea]
MSWKSVSLEENEKMLYDYYKPHFQRQQPEDRSSLVSGPIALSVTPKTQQIAFTFALPYSSSFSHSNFTSSPSTTPTSHAGSPSNTDSYTSSSRSSRSVSRSSRTSSTKRSSSRKTPRPTTTCPTYTPQNSPPHRSPQPSTPKQQQQQSSPSPQPDAGNEDEVPSIQSAQRPTVYPNGVTSLNDAGPVDERNRADVGGGFEMVGGKQMLEVLSGLISALTGAAAAESGSIVTVTDARIHVLTEAVKALTTAVLLDVTVSQQRRADEAALRELLVNGLQNQTTSAAPETQTQQAQNPAPEPT